MSTLDVARERAAGILAEQAQGTILLVKVAKAAADTETPWLLGEASLTPYALDAVCKGVSAEYVDGTRVLASDRLVIAAPLDGVVPELGDLVAIDGMAHEIRRIEPRPSADTPAMWHIVVAGVAARPYA